MSQQAPTITINWVDLIFRGLRRGTNLELALSVLVTAEMIAKVYYAAVYLATQSPVLRTLCEQILHDEAAHVQFHIERLAHIGRACPRLIQRSILIVYRLLFCAACSVVLGKACSSIPLHRDELLNVFAAMLARVCCGYAWIATSDRRNPAIAT
jgi:hypothetical protein